MGHLERIAAKHDRGGHSIFSPSSAAMWSVCEGSLVPNALSHDKTTAEAAEGTVAHAMAEVWLRTGERPTAMVGKVVVEDGYPITVTDGMLAYVELYVEWCHEALGDHYVEQRLTAAPGLMPIPNQGGTVDFAALAHHRARLVDLKYGKGLKVFAENNPQLQLYAVYLFDAWDWYYDFHTIEISICQPRLDHFDTWVITRDQLLAFRAWIADRARAAWRLDAPRTPGEKVCQWCAVKRECPAYLTWFAGLRELAADDCFGPAEPADGAGFDVATMAAAARDAEDPFADDPIRLPELSVEAWCRILPMRKAVEAWFAAGETKVFAAAVEGDAPGYKVVEGRANRVWKDEIDAQTRMVEVGIPLDETESRKLLSPNQAEELLQARTRMGKTKARQLFESFTDHKDGGRTLVRSADKREALPSHGDVFDEE